MTATMKRAVLLGVVIFLLGPLGQTVFAADPVIEQARELIEKSDSKAAYDLLIPLQSERAGNPDYDLLLGVAANDTGKYSEAVFALERVLAVQPNNARARAEIARAYFALGERPTAKSEFESVKKQGVPPEVAAAIQKYLDAIAKVESAERTTLAAYFELTAGHDTNVNAATAGNQIAVPVFGGSILTLNPAGVQLGDNFGSVGSGASLRHMISPKVALLAGVDLNKRVNYRYDAFDTGTRAANVGFNVTDDKNSYTLAYQMLDFYLDNNLYRSARGAVGQYQRTIDEANVVTAYAQYTPLEYPGQEVRNADRTVAGVAYARALSGTHQPVIFLGGYGGSEKEKSPGVPHLGHQLLGLRLGGQFNVNDIVVPFIALSYEERRYGGPDPLFVDTRFDQQFDQRLGLNYTPAKLWTVTPQVVHTRNYSNIAINRFERTQMFVTVRRDFR